MQRKLIKVGTSAGVLVPREVLKEQGVKIGDMLEVNFRKQDIAAMKRQATVDPRIIEWTDRFIAKHRSLLRKLAKA